MYCDQKSWEYSKAILKHSVTALVFMLKIVKCDLLLAYLIDHWWTPDAESARPDKL
jgi:hypothetical protein